MIRKITTILFVALIIVLALYLATKNSDPVTLYFNQNWQITASLGVVAMGCFALGILIATLVSSYFGIRSYWREQRLIWKDKRSREFWRQISRARGYLATGDLKRAHNIWNDLITSDPTNTIARTELAKVFLTEQQPLEALRLLDEARADDKHCLEVLMLAHQVNLQLGNRTAALDNLALLIQNHPTPLTAKLARDLAETLGRPEEALRYHEIIYSLGAKTDDYDSIKARLEYGKLSATLNKSDPEGSKNTLKAFLKKYRNFPLALARLAEIEESAGNKNTAAQLLADAARSANDFNYWHKAARLWLKNNSPDAAISAAKIATREATGHDLLNAELELIRLYIATGKLEDAESHLNNFGQLASQNGLSALPEQIQNALVLSGLCLNRAGKYKEAAAIWKKLSKFDFELPELPHNLGTSTSTTINSAPSPVLSTP